MGKKPVGKKLSNDRSSGLTRLPCCRQRETQSQFLLLILLLLLIPAAEQEQEQGAYELNLRTVISASMPFC